MRKYFAFVLFLTFCFATPALRAADYQYPYHDPYLATSTTAILSDDGATADAKSRIIRVPGLPGRNKLPALEGRGDVSLAFYRQNHSAPVLFILAGLGSNPYFGVAPYLASLFYRDGNHVIILPSPMSWNFAVSASRSGAPGNARVDAQDFYVVMQNSLKVLRDQYGVRPTAINFMAVSLGALEGAYLSVIDADEGKIGIAKYLLVNPPVDLAYAVKKIDAWKALAHKFGREKSQGTVAKALAIVDSFANERRDDPAVFDRLAKKFAEFTIEELQFLIAENLYSQLSELIYVTQVMHDQRILTAPPDEMRKRLDEAKNISFADYNEKIALPLWQKQLGDSQANLQSFIDRGSLVPIRRTSRQPVVSG